MYTTSSWQPHKKWSQLNPLGFTIKIQKFAMLYTTVHVHVHVRVPMMSLLMGCKVRLLSAVAAALTTVSWEWFSSSIIRDSPLALYTM